MSNTTHFIIRNLKMYRCKTLISNESQNNEFSTKSVKLQDSVCKLNN